MAPVGIAGRLARTFIQSKLTPLIIAGSVLLGIGAVSIGLAYLLYSRRDL